MSSWCHEERRNGSEYQSEKDDYGHGFGILMNVSAYLEGLDENDADSG